MEYIDIKKTSPVERHENLYFKRDDKFEICGVKGGKARAAYQLILKGIEEGYDTFVTAGSRMSPQCELISYICESLCYKCHLFMPEGNATSVIEHINSNSSSTIHYVTYPKFVNVVCSKAKKFAEENKYCYIPFGMECEENINITMHQVNNVPKDCHKIIIPAGSAMSMISVINGLEYYNRYDVEVVGVRVGKDFSKTLKKYVNAPHIKYNIVMSESDYSKPATVTTLEGVVLDPIYESKCIDEVTNADKQTVKDEYKNALFWIVGKRL